MMDRFFSRLCMSCLFFAAVARVSAQSGQMADSIQKIDEVTVFSNKIKDVVPSQTLSGERLHSLNSFSVADAIRYFSGVQIKDYGGVGGLKTVDVRSMGTNHMGVFYDGIQLGNAQNGQIDLGKFSLDNIEEISLYNGQRSSIFQPAKDYGSSGTIYLRSRRPKFAAGKPYNVRSAFRAGSFGLANPSFLWEQKLTDCVSASLNAEYTYATGKYKFRYRKVFSDGTVAWDTTATRQNGDIRALRLEGALNGRIDNGYWNSKVYYYDSERGIPGAIVSNVWKRSQRQWDRNFFAQGTFLKTFGRYELQANVKYANDYMHYLNPDTTLMYIDNEFRQHELYASLANHYEVTDNWDVALSADYQLNTLDATLENFVNPRRNTLLIAAATTYSHGRLRVMGSMLGTFVDENVTRGTTNTGGQQGTPDDFHAFTPAVYLSYSPLRGRRAKELSLRAFYKRIFRMPTFNDLYYTDVGNISLRPEYTTQTNLGVQYEKTWARGMVSKLDAKADIYYNVVSDKIIAVPKGNGQYRWMMMNIGKVKIRGVDVNVNAVWHLSRELALQTAVAYTWQKAQDYSDPTDNGDGGTYKGQIAYIPWHNGSVTGNMTYRGWGLNYSFSYVGERYHNSSNIRANHEQPWYTHDLGLTKTIVVKRVRMTAALEVNNVLDQQYDVVLNYPMPGRNYKVILKFDI